MIAPAGCIVGFAEDQGISHCNLACSSVEAVLVTHALVINRIPSNVWHITVWACGLIRSCACVMHINSQCTLFMPPACIRHFFRWQTYWQFQACLINNEFGTLLSMRCCTQYECIRAAHVCSTKNTSVGRQQQHNACCSLSSTRRIAYYMVFATEYAHPHKMLEC